MPKKKDDSINITKANVKARTKTKELKVKELKFPNLPPEDNNIVNSGSVVEMHPERKNAMVIANGKVKTLNAGKLAKQREEERLKNASIQEVLKKINKSRVPKSMRDENYKELAKLMGVEHLSMEVAGVFKAYHNAIKNGDINALDKIFKYSGYEPPTKSVNVNLNYERSIEEDKELLQGLRRTMGGTTD